MQAIVQQAWCSSLLALRASALDASVAPQTFENQAISGTPAPDRRAKSARKKHSLIGFGA